MTTLNISKYHVPTVGDMQLMDIVHVLENYGRNDFDLIGVLDTMKRLGLIQHETHQRLRNKYRYGRIANSSATFHEFIMEVILCVTSFDTLCYVLERCGSAKISKELRMSRYKNIYKPIPIREIVYSKRTHDYYKVIKSCVDNNGGKKKRDMLQKFIDDFREKVVDKTIDESDRQFAMEKTVAATVVLVTLHTDYNERKQILETAVRTETNGIDNTSLRIVYHSKLAVTEAQAGHVASAEEHVAQTKLLCTGYCPCFAVTSALHDIEYTSKTFFFMNPTEDNLERVLKDGDLAFQSVENNEEVVRNLWQRIMLLFMVLSLLLITPDFKVVDMKQVHSKNKKLARQIIKAVLARSDDIEHRRKMIVSLCQATLSEETDLDLAESYAQEAVAAAEAGGCFRGTEKTNVVAYLAKIRWLKKRRCILRVCLCLLVLLLSICLIYFTLVN